MIFRAGLAMVLCLVLHAAAYAQEQLFQFDGASDHFQLNQGLTEISGLAVASKNSVYAHNDEHGIVYEINIADGKIVAAFALGSPTARADFEGIAAYEGRIYLVTSAGLIYEAIIGAHRARVRYNIFDTGISEFCEVEGISPGPRPAEFLLICKTTYKTTLGGHLVIFKWSLAERGPVNTPWLKIPLTNLLTPEERKKFRPSAIEWLPQNNSLIVLSARNQVALSLNRDGTLLSKKALAPANHPQAEGIAFMPTGDLVIADEGTMRLPGALTIYKVVP